MVLFLVPVQFAMVWCYFLLFLRHGPFLSPARIDRHIACVPLGAQLSFYKNVLFFLGPLSERIIFVICFFDA